MTERPPTRYGRQRQSRRTRRRIIGGLTLLILAVGVAVAVVGYQRLGRSGVAGALAGYRLIDDETVEVTVTVSRADPSRPAACIVRGRSKDGSETGRRGAGAPVDTGIGAGDDHRQDQTTRRDGRRLRLRFGRAWLFGRALSHADRPSCGIAKA